MILFVAATAYADHPSVGLVPQMAGPIITIPAVVLPRHGWSLDARLEVVRFDEFSRRTAGIIPKPVIPGPYPGSRAGLDRRFLNSGSGPGMTTGYIFKE